MVERNTSLLNFKIKWIILYLNGHVGEDFANFVTIELYEKIDKENKSYIWNNTFSNKLLHKNTISMSRAANFIFLSDFIG